MGAQDYVYIPQAPNIDISLYGDAMAQGAQVGNAIPTTTTAIIRGAKEGLEWGQQFTSNQERIETQRLENQIRQNTIDQQPVSNAMAEERLETARMQNDMLQTRAEIDQATQKEQYAVTKATLDAEKVQKQSSAELWDQNLKFSAEWEQADPLRRKEMLFSGRYNQLFAAMPSIFGQSLSQMPEGSLTAEEEYRGQLMYQMTNLKRQNDRESERARTDYAKARATALEGDIDDIAARNDMTEEALVSSDWKAEPAGTYVKDSAGRLKKNADGTGWQMGPGAGATNPTSFDIILGDKVIASNVPTKIKDSWTKMRGSVDIMGGTALTRSARDLRRTLAKTYGQQLPPEDAAAAPQAEQPDASKPAPQRQVGSERKIAQEAKAAAEAAEFAKKAVKPDVAAKKILPTTQVVDVNGDVNFLGTKEQPSYVPEVVRQTVGLNEKDYTEIKPTVKRYLLNLEMAAQSKPWFSREWLEYDRAENLNQRSAAKAEIAEYAAGKEWDADSNLHGKFTQEMVDAYNEVVRNRPASLDQVELQKRQNQILAAQQKLQGLYLPSLFLGNEEIKTPKDLYALTRQPFFLGLLSNFETVLLARAQQQKTAGATQKVAATDFQSIVIQSQSQAQ